VVRHTSAGTQRVWRPDDSRRVLFRAKKYPVRSISLYPNRGRWAGGRQIRAGRCCRCSTGVMGPTIWRNPRISRVFCGSLRSEKRNIGRYVAGRLFERPCHRAAARVTRIGTPRIVFGWHVAFRQAVVRRPVQASHASAPSARTVPVAVGPNTWCSPNRIVRIRRNRFRPYAVRDNAHLGFAAGLRPYKGTSSHQHDGAAHDKLAKKNAAEDRARAPHLHTLCRGCTVEIDVRRPIALGCLIRHEHRSSVRADRGV